MLIVTFGYGSRQSPDLIRIGFSQTPGISRDKSIGKSSHKLDSTSLRSLQNGKGLPDNLPRKASRLLR